MNRLELERLPCSDENPQHSQHRHELGPVYSHEYSHDLRSVYSQRGNPTLIVLFIVMSIVLDIQLSLFLINICM